ncbi:2Fe-2S iron-sulfur cluster-binding protein [Pseudonocardia broussonetiae]|uniref:(2Fe-2S)-binding protein n=1 Tax=Pseudonocardia broussonetiae TaxID=2736640 RepID=A0A6M6JGM8_9PSEU|nr:2Fe-2S iron-sulfur cluster-binding protein [Pseudonocardia broussonetiae]QJY46077.1 (2Fe-2S)-binding protein [Pseudonocardia broussonetiae]
MPSLIFVLPDGTRRTVEGEAGLSVMQVALAEDLPGIVAECGGNAMCATCHVYAAAPERLPPVKDIEDEMLTSTAAPRRPTSRLSCQVEVVDDWGEMTFVLPETQL